ncbi:hypothetical protein HYDPIDRAFT_118192 [Hydnomerulius pinastri MD-312]|uniref:Uncharacterized protein n=1 Tax=Hydnomerulius pinastri MD-312 TaxID=994086 RepID=A0A0C9W948_9AGAM|nr:hypothetical protein HYDPIDRAFT_118192 [Hydnomerulius pinastri MD-312]
MLTLDSDHHSILRRCSSSHRYPSLAYLDSSFGASPIQKADRDDETAPAVELAIALSVAKNRDRNRTPPPDGKSSLESSFAAVKRRVTMLSELSPRRVTRGFVLCFILHGLLVVLHLILLGLYVPHVEHRLVMQLGSQSNIAGTAITIAMQSFITGYAAILVVCAQRLALRRNLCLRQTLTATHDLSASWTGLGSALVSLWRQRYIRSSLLGTISIVLYLGGIAVLHVTTSTLLSLQSFNGTAAVPVLTSPALSGLSSANIQSYDWADASSVMRLLDRLPEMTVVGLSNNTLSDVLQDTSGTGNTTVNATTFEVKCGTLPNAGNSGPLPDGSVLITVSYGANSTLSMLVPPLCDKNSIQYFVPNSTELSGSNMLFYTTVPIVDSARGQVSNTTDSVTWDDAGRNSTINMFTQYFGCTLSSTSHTVLVDSKTNKVLSGGIIKNSDQNPLWEPWQPGSPVDGGKSVQDPSVDWVRRAGQ